MIAPNLPRMEVGLEATVNEALADAYTRHAINLSRLENAQAREVIAYLNAEVFPEVMGKVEAKMLGLSPRGLGALESVTYAKLMDDVKGLFFGGFRRARGDFARQLYRMARAEAQFSITALGKELKFDFRSKIPDFKTFKRLVYKQPINGHTLGKRFDLLAANTFSRFQREVNIGLANGETADSIVRRIRGTAGARYKDGVLGRARQWTNTERPPRPWRTGHGRPRTRRMPISSKKCSGTPCSTTPARSASVSTGRRSRWVRHRPFQFTPTAIAF